MHKIKNYKKNEYENHHKLKYQEEASNKLKK